MTRHLLPAIWLPAILLLCAAPAAASVVEAMDVSSLARQSSHVVVAKVVDAQSSWDASGMRIHTVYALQVEETLAGTAAPRLEVFQWGGSVGDIGQMTVGEAVLTPGLRAVFFLSPVEHAAGRGKLACTGLAQGVMPVFNAPDGTVKVGRPPAQLGVRFPGALPSKPPVVLEDAGVPPMTLVDLKAAVVKARLVKSGTVKP